MELRFQREVGVGVMLVVATAVFVFLLMWLRGRSFRSGEIVRVTFSDVAGLKEGDWVRTSGVNVGKVKRVVLEAPGQVSVYLDVHRDRAELPRVDARASVRALDFFGARYVEYSPGTASARLDSLQPIRGSRDQDITDMAQGLSGQGRDLLANATELLSPSTTAELRGVLAEARRTIQRLGELGQGPSRELTNALVSVRQVFQRLDILLANNTAPATQTMQHMRDASANMEQVTATLQRTSLTLDSLMTKINSGRGTLGQLVNDTTLMADLRRTNTALADLLVDFRTNPRKYINVSVF